MSVAHISMMAGGSSLSSNAKVSTKGKTEMASGASYPTFLEPLTKNEKALLDMYDKIKHYEKEAARLKAEEAKRRLEEADERYRAKVRERERAEGKLSEDEKEDSSIDDRKTTAKQSIANTEEYAHESEAEEDREVIERRKKRDEEITKLRKDVNAAKDAQSQKEAQKAAVKEQQEAMRRELLGEKQPEVAKKQESKKRPLQGNPDDEDDENDYQDEEAEDESTKQLSVFTGPSIKKKQHIDKTSWDENKPKPSLLDSMGGDTTPIHEFSKKLGMSKVSLDGSVLYPQDASHTPWTPPDRPIDFIDGSLELELSDFDPSVSHGGNNTIAIKFHAPEESQRFSINIAAPNNDNYNNILFHFNPRHFQRGGNLVINDRKETRWGNDLSVPLSTLPLMFGVQSCTLIIQINEEGFDVFVEGVHCARLEHRIDLPKKGKGSLFLQFPSSDDYGNPENWMVYRVWWGRKQSMADDLNDVAGVNIYASVHPKKLFVSGLSKCMSDPEVDLRRAELERAFRKYGGPSGIVAVSVQKNSTFAFVEVASEQQADLALLEMANSGRYRINKARRTKHEALLEERSAKEAMEKGTAKESVDWD